MEGSNHLLQRAHKGLHCLLLHCLVKHSPQLQLQLRIHIPLHFVKVAVISQVELIPFQSFALLVTL